MGSSLSTVFRAWKQMKLSRYQTLVAKLHQREREYAELHELSESFFRCSRECAQRLKHMETAARAADRALQKLGRKAPIGLRSVSNLAKRLPRLPGRFGVFPAPSAPSAPFFFLFSFLFSLGLFLPKDWRRQGRLFGGRGPGAAPGTAPCQSVPREVKRPRVKSSVAHATVCPLRQERVVDSGSLGNDLKEQMEER